MALFGGVTIPGKPDPSNVRKLDLLPIPQIRRMQRNGIAIDLEYLRGVSEDLGRTMEGLKQEIGGYVDPTRLEQFVGMSGEDLVINPDSSEQIAELLYDQLKLDVGERIKRTKGGNRLTTGKKVLEQLKRKHKVVQLILNYREASKLKGTYADKLPKIARLHKAGKRCDLCGRRHWADHWRIHTQIVTTRTDTGRLASRDPNLQNIPARTKLGAKIRRAFCAQPGYRLVQSDYAQIELRLLGHLAQELQMIRIFMEGGDIHLDTAMRAFGITDPTKVDKMLHRAPAKSVNFGTVYGLGDVGLLDLMAVTYATAGLELPSWIDQDWCANFITVWFGLYPDAHAYLEEQHNRAQRYDMVWTPMGRVRLVPETRSEIERVRAAGLRQAGNMPVQGFAADVMKLGMAIVEEQWEGARSAGLDLEALLPVHDELISEVEEDWADEAVVWQVRGMQEALVDRKTGIEQSLVPIKADGKSMERWEK